MSLPLISLVHLTPRKSSTPRLAERDGQRGWPFINPLMVMKCSFVSIGVVFHKYQGWNSISRYDKSHDTIFIAKLKRSPAVSAYCIVVCLSPFPDTEELKCFHMSVLILASTSAISQTLPLGSTSPLVPSLGLQRGGKFLVNIQKLSLGS